MCILSDEEKQDALDSARDKIYANRKRTTITERDATRDEPTSICLYPTRL